MNSFPTPMGVGLTSCAAAIVGVVLLASFTSWWVLFALFAIPPLLFGAVAVATVSLSRSCGEMPCASWFERDIANSTPVR